MKFSVLLLRACRTGGLLVALSAAVASAQTAPSTAVDQRWGPWLGCWQLADESNQEALLGQPSSLGRRRATEPVFVCVTPASGGVTKAATLETGLQIRVPLFIKEGEKVKVHTETREFAGRA